MIAKKENSRIDFDVVFDFIENSKLFDKFKEGYQVPEV